MLAPQDLPHALQICWSFHKNLDLQLAPNGSDELIWFPAVNLYRFNSHHGIRTN